MNKLCDFGKPFGVNPITKRKHKISPSRAGCSGNISFRPSVKGPHIAVCKGHEDDYNFTYKMLSENSEKS